MANKNSKIGLQDKQMGLFELLSQDQGEQEAPKVGRLCISDKLLEAVKSAVKKAPKSRATLVDEMSELCGSVITVHMLNGWLADSHPHRLPVEFLPALCVATGSTEPIRIVAEASGLFTLAGPDALRADMQKDLEKKRELDRQIRRKEALIRALEIKK